MEGTRAVVLVLFCIVISQAFAQTAKKQGNTTKPTTKPTVAPADLKCSVYNITIKLTNISFSNDLLNVHSRDFTKTRIELEAGIQQVFNGYKPFTAIKVQQFVKAGDGKVLAVVFLEFNLGGKGPHLKNLIAVVAKGKIGIFPCQQTLVKAACYVNTPVSMVCTYPCPAICAPDCSSPCCSQYQPPVYTASPPPVVASPPPPCPPPCNPVCAPTCNPACCQTAYAGPYGKRHKAPKPSKEDVQKLKKHLLKKHNKKSTKHE